MQEQKDKADFMEELGKLNIYAQSYLKDQVEYTKLRVAEASVKTISSVIHAIVLSLFAFLLIVFLSVVGGLYLGKMLENYALGFLLVSAFHLILMILYLIFKRQLVSNPIAGVLIKKILADSSEKKNT